MNPPLTALCSVAPSSFIAQLRCRAQARRTIRQTVYKLIAETRAKDTGSATIEKSARSGVQPGSFLDLLIHATNKETGKPFTDLQV